MADGLLALLAVRKLEGRLKWRVWVQVMTDRWFKEWMYQVAVDVEMLPADVAAILDQTPTVLPAWDPMVRPPTLCFATCG